MPKIRIRLLHIPDVHRHRLPPSQLEYVVTQNDGRGTFNSGATRFTTLTLTEALAHLRSERGSSVEIKERHIRAQWWRRSNPSRHSQSFNEGASVWIERSEDGFIISKLIVGPHGIQPDAVCDFTDNDGIELVGRMTMETVELEVDRPQ